MIVTLCVGASNFLCLPIMGAVSDRVGRRPMLGSFSVLTLLTAYPALSWLVAAPSFSRLMAVELWFSFLPSLRHCPSPCRSHARRLREPALQTVREDLRRAERRSAAEATEIRVRSGRGLDGNSGERFKRDIRRVGNSRSDVHRKRRSRLPYHSPRCETPKRTGYRCTWSLLSTWGQHRGCVGNRQASEDGLRHSSCKIQICSLRRSGEVCSTRRPREHP